jgi:hypothetical protein
MFPYVNWYAVGREGANGIVAAGLVALLAFALPLGGIVHQVSITLFSPFRPTRLLQKRTALSEAKDAVSGVVWQDVRPRSIVTFLQSIELRSDAADGNVSVDIEHLRQEVSARYSYYYVRLDNGVFAPLAGGLIAKAIYLCLAANYSEVLRREPICPLYILVGCAVGIGALLVGYLPELMREIDDLEKLMIRICREMCQS